MTWVNLNNFIHHTSKESKAAKHIYSLNELHSEMNKLDKNMPWYG